MDVRAETSKTTEDYPTAVSNTNGDTATTQPTNASKDEGQDASNNPRQQPEDDRSSSKNKVSSGHKALLSKLPVVQAPGQSSLASKLHTNPQAKSAQPNTQTPAPSLAALLGVSKRQNQKSQSPAPSASSTKAAMCKPWSLVVKDPLWAATTPNSSMMSSPPDTAGSAGSAQASEVRTEPSASVGPTLNEAALAARKEKRGTPFGALETPPVREAPSGRVGELLDITDERRGLWAAKTPTGRSSGKLSAAAAAISAFSTAGAPSQQPSGSLFSATTQPLFKAPGFWAPFPSKKNESQEPSKGTEAPKEKEATPPPVNQEEAPTEHPTEPELPTEEKPSRWLGDFWSTVTSPNPRSNKSGKPRAPYRGELISSYQQEGRYVPPSMRAKLAANKRSAPSESSATSHEVPKEAEPPSAVPPPPFSPPPVVSFRTGSVERRGSSELTSPPRQQFSQLCTFDTMDGLPRWMDAALTGSHPEAPSPPSKAPPSLDCWRRPAGQRPTAQRLSSSESSRDAPPDSSAFQYRDHLILPVCQVHPGLARAWISRAPASTTPPATGEPPEAPVHMAHYASDAPYHQRQYRQLMEMTSPAAPQQPLLVHYDPPETLAPSLHSNPRMPTPLFFGTSSFPFQPPTSSYGGFFAPSADTPIDPSYPPEPPRYSEPSWQPDNYIPRVQDQRSSEARKPKHKPQAYKQRTPANPQRTTLASTAAAIAQLNKKNAAVSVDAILH